MEGVAVVGVVVEVDGGCREVVVGGVGIVVEVGVGVEREVVVRGGAE